MTVEVCEGPEVWGHTPGFLIRRLHQIHLALFAEECTGFDVTAVQFNVLQVIGERPGSDQSSIAEEVGVDRATLASVLSRLERAGFIKRIVSRLDRRQRLISLTARGRSIVEKMTEAVQRAHERTLAPLTPEDRASFLVLLSRLVEEGNGHGRAKLRLRLSAEGG
jgi:DNA-binding MarR family transcriptional regulator